MTAPITNTPTSSSTLPLPTATSGTSSSSTSGTSGSSGSSSSSTNPLAGMNDNISQSEFMQLLVAQVTHQDPLDPTDSTQMAAELAQFAQLEQLTNINTTLSGQGTDYTNLTSAVNNSAALELIGKTVTAQSNQIAVGPGGTTSVSTTVPSGSSGDLVLTITDANGTKVATKDLGQVTAGTQTVQLSSLTNGLASGAYTTQFTLTDASGNVTNPAATITATVSGVTFGSSGAEVTSGPLTIPIGSISSVTSN